METSSPSVKEGEGFPARNAWSGRADNESFAQVVKKSERKKRPLETKEGFPASKGLSDVLHEIDWNIFFFLFEADFIQLVVLNLSHLNYIKLCLFLTSNER